MASSSFLYNRSSAAHDIKCQSDGNTRIDIIMHMCAHQPHNNIRIKSNQFEIHLLQKETESLMEILIEGSEEMQVERENRMVVLPNRLELVRSVDLRGNWSTSLVHIVHGRSHINDLQITEEHINLTIELYDWLIYSLKEMLPHFRLSLLVHEQDSKMKLISRTSLVNRHWSAEYFLTLDDARRGEGVILIDQAAYDKAVKLRETYSYLLLHSQPQSDANEPINLDDNCININLRFDNGQIILSQDTTNPEPTHRFEEVIVPRPSSYSVCLHIACMLYESKICEYYQDDGSISFDQCGELAQNYLKDTWARYQRMCSDILYKLNFNLNTPTAEFCKYLLGASDPGSPLQVALEQIKKSAVIHCGHATATIFNRFFKNY